MNINELDSYNLADAVKFNDQLNPRIWQGEKMKPQVRQKLLAIADDFRQSLGLSDLEVKDITVSGSNAGYTYTPNSDIDLHLVVDIPQADSSEVYRELFDAKKYQYNEEHNISIGGYDVELYVENANKTPVSQGIYSVANDDWVNIPLKRRSTVNDNAVKNKYDVTKHRIESAVASKNFKRISQLAAKIKKMRQSGLDKNGELGPENLAYKMLRTQGFIKKLYDAKTEARDRQLSLKEQPRETFRYGYGSEVDETSLADMRAAFQSELKPVAGSEKEKVYHSRDEYELDKKQKAKQQEIAKSLVQVKHKPWSGGVYEGHQGQPYSSEDGVAPSTQMFLNEEDPNGNILQQFIQDVAERLGIESMPEIILHDDPAWGENNHSFGRYDPDTHTLNVSLPNRHILDVLRTTAHELTHCRQNELAELPDDAGATGSKWENEANTMAGIIMRDFADAHPELFDEEALKESASGYIPTKKQAKDPRYSMALTVDIKPGQLGKEANKLNLGTDSQGHPDMVYKSVNLRESLAAEFALFEEQDLFEINMGSKNLRREAAKTGAIAGMEFEMIVPNVEGGGDDGDLEPDYEYDQRCRSIQDAYDFFYDGDYNTRRSCDEMRVKMQEDFQEWLDEKISEDWDRQGEEYIYQWVKDNVDESEWNPEDKSDLERTEALEEYAANVHADPMSDQYQSAYEEFREENQENWDESDWLDDADLSSMREIENAYSMEWPHWSSPQGGEAEISDVAQEFENAIGRDVRASDNYHSGSTLRPSVTNQRYIVEPDGSLEPDDPGDRGLEFVSPPLPIDEILSDLNKVKAWAKEYGCYTNDSTGLHINISVPDYSREKLDYVKLALLMGDKYVLDAFGRAGNTYAKSALDIVKKAVRDRPEEAEALLNKMKGNLDQLATKAIHSGVTAKYTSINTKDGHIEFRSPGGDWLDQNFDQIENTLLRFTVAMSAAMNPEAYRQEYLTKLYQLLSENNRDVDTIKYFSDYVAGKIPKAALRSFVKQAQLQRNIKRGKTDGQKMWWKVYKYGRDIGRYGATVEVVATSEEEAKQKAAKEWGEPLIDAVLSQFTAEPLRPYVEQPDKPGSGTYELYDRRTNETIPDTEFSSRNDADVQTRLDDYINLGQHGLSTIDARLLFGARPVAVPADEPEEGVLNNSLRPTGPGPWEIYNRNAGHAVLNLIYNGEPVTDRGTAQRLAMTRIASDQMDNYGVRTRGTSGMSNIGTQTDMENRLGLPSQSATANYAVVDRQTLDPVFRFRADDRRDANRIYGSWLAAAGLPTTTEDFGFQEIRPQIPEVPMDVAQNFPDRTDGRNIDYSFRDLFGNTDQASSAPAGNSFSGQWKVMLDGEEVWRFRGVGNNQADANRIAQTWLQDQRRQGSLSPAPGAEIEVLPVMIESIQEGQQADYKIHDIPKLDKILSRCCQMVIRGQQVDPNRYGQVAACVIDPDNNFVYGINLPGPDGQRQHAERVAIDKYRKTHGDIPEGSIIVTTCSPCNSPMDERYGESCKDLLNSAGIHKVYAGYIDPTQHDDADADFVTQETDNDKLWGRCQLFAQTCLGSEELVANE